MKTLPAALEAHLASGATTLCWCWRLETRAGTVTGFTDHDRPVSFDGIIYEPQAGFTASDVKESLGLSVDNLEVEGALRSDSLTEADLAKGRYDDANVRIYRVNWREPDQRYLLKSGSLGEVRRSGSGFVAEVRGLAHYLNQPTGRIYQYPCDADLGDNRCQVDLDGPAYAASGTVVTIVSDHVFVATGLDAFTSGWFTHGLVIFGPGNEPEQTVEIKDHVNTGLVTRLTSWHRIEAPIAPGWTFVIRAGCDKSIATCRAKFGNAVNFRGFPDMPGNDFLTIIQSKG